MKLTVAKFILLGSSGFYGLAQVEPYGGIMQLGSFGVILVSFALLAWKGVPAFNTWLGTVLATFKAEISAERLFASQELDKFREAQQKSEERITAAVERNTAATQALKTAVEELAKK